MHWVLKVVRIEESYVVLDGDAGEFVLPRSEVPKRLSIGDVVRLEHAVRQGRAKLGCLVLARA